MICVGSDCDKCKNKTGKIDNWKPACKAFPEGIPSSHYGNQHGKKCNNGIGYGPDPEKVKILILIISPR